MFSVIFLMDWPRTDQRNLVVIGRLAWGKGAVRRPKALFLSYFAKSPLIRLTRSGPLRAWPKFECYKGVVVQNTFMVGSIMGRPWS